MSERNKTDMPHEIADWVTRPFTRFLRVEAAAGGLLLLAVVLAVVLANSHFSSQFLGFWEIPVGVRFGPVEFTRTIRHWINDGLMTLFFFVISLELKRQLVFGELRHLRTAALPLAAAVGGMIGPVSLYLIQMNGHAGMDGWGTVMATDTAFVIGCLALFGSRIPSALRLFLLSLAIFDDVGAILVVAAGYGEALNWPALVFGFLAIGLVYIVASVGIRSISVYTGLGILVWLAFDASGIHATIAGVILGLLTPSRVWLSKSTLRANLDRVLANTDSSRTGPQEQQELHQAGRAVTESVSPLERLEFALHPWVGFAIMPLFAFANAGIAIDTANIGQPLSLAIGTSLVLGKPLGVFVFSWTAVQTGIATRAPTLGWWLIGAGAMLTGIGFTMSLFIAELAFPPEIIDDAKIGILAGSFCAGILGLLLLTVAVWKNKSLPVKHDDKR